MVSVGLLRASGMIAPTAFYDGPETTPHRVDERLVQDHHPVV